MLTRVINHLHIFDSFTIYIYMLLGHVIPPHHLLPVVLCKGPAGEVLEFSFQSRDRHCMVGRVMHINIPSYTINCAYQY